MCNLIKKEFNLKRDIVEVESGIFPLLGHYLSEEKLQLGKGTVTVYDAKVWKNYPTKAKLVDRYFDDRVQLPENSLLVGLFPCQATKSIIEKALKENLEFGIALCGCNHSNILSLSTLEYHRRLIEQLMGQISREKFLKIKYFPETCFGKAYQGLPIIVVKDKPKVKFFSLPFKTR
ncbi:MAG: hypothetical protein HFH08_03675 [Bacilli bacterium]|nr:hypothetical protein [Bacilli bacterium]